MGQQSVELIGKDHIDLIVTALIVFGQSDQTPKTQKRIADHYGCAFVVQNLDSWNYCNPEDLRTDPSYQWEPVIELVDAYFEHEVTPGRYLVQLMKAIEYYEEQSSEHPEWDDSDNGIREICRMLRQAFGSKALDWYLEWPKNERPDNGGRHTWRGWNAAASHWTRQFGFKAIDVG